MKFRPIKIAVRNKKWLRHNRKSLYKNNNVYYNPNGGTSDSGFYKNLTRMSRKNRNKGRMSLDFLSENIITCKKLLIEKVVQAVVNEKRYR